MTPDHEDAARKVTEQLYTAIITAHLFRGLTITSGDGDRGFTIKRETYGGLTRFELRRGKCSLMASFFNSKRPHDILRAAREIAAKYVDYTKEFLEKTYSEYAGWVNETLADQLDHIICEADGGGSDDDVMACPFVADERPAGIFHNTRLPG
jgi:hypothetical protein